MSGRTENLQLERAKEEERIPPRYPGNSETTMYHQHIRHAYGDASGVRQGQTDDIRECSEVARNASRQRCASRDGSACRQGSASRQGCRGCASRPVCQRCTTCRLHLTMAAIVSLQNQLYSRGSRTQGH